MLWGSFSSIAFLMQSPAAKGASIFVSSPLPLVFTSYNNVETFSTVYSAKIEFKNGMVKSYPLDHARYNRLQGSYNRRNVYGAVFSHGPFFSGMKLLRLRNSILRYAICTPGDVAKELGFSDIKYLIIKIRSKTEGHKDKVWKMYVEC